MAGGQRLPARLVDLPTITESMMTFDNQRFVKVADISQMLVVEDPTLSSSTGVPFNRPTGDTAEEDMARRHAITQRKRSDYQWPDGLTMPLRNCRKQRFRKRVDRHVIPNY